MHRVYVHRVYLLLFSFWFIAIFWKPEPASTMRTRPMEGTGDLRGTWRNTGEWALMVTVEVHLVTSKGPKKNIASGWDCGILILPMDGATLRHLDLVFLVHLGAGKSACWVLIVSLFPAYGWEGLLKSYSTLGAFNPPFGYSDFLKRMVLSQIQFPFYDAFFCSYNNPFFLHKVHSRSVGCNKELWNWANFRVGKYICKPRCCLKVKFAWKNSYYLE